MSGRISPWCHLLDNEGADSLICSSSTKGFAEQFSLFFKLFVIQHPIAFGVFSDV